MKRLLFILISVFFLPTILLTQEINWQQEFEGYLNNQLTYTYSGGFDYGRPALVDIDNDKDLDLFVGEREGGIDFIRNVGTALEPKWRLESKNYFNFEYDDNYYAPAFCDIDADGDQDVFIGSHIGRIIFMQNDGTPTKPVWTKITEEFMQIDVGYQSRPAFGDLDQDGDFDLTIGALDSVVFYRNTGNTKIPKFSRLSSRADENSPFYQYFDMEKDGDQDYLVGLSNRVQLYENKGNNQFELLDDNFLNLYGKGYAWAMDFGDLDHDGDLDLIVFSPESGVRYYRNEGSPTKMNLILQDEYYLTIQTGVTSYIALADFDNDSDLDMFAGGYYAGIYKIINSGTKKIPKWTLTGEKLVTDGDIPVFCDIDGDKDLDLFCGTIHGDITYYENTGTVMNPVYKKGILNYSKLSTGKYFFPAFYDIDNDGDFDLFTGRENGQLSFYRNIGTAKSPAWAKPDTAYANIQTNEIRNSPAFHDIDNDGDADLFIGTYSGNIIFYRNIGNRSAAKFEFVTTDFDRINVGSSAKPVFADIDDDGDADLFVGEDDGGVDFFRNNGRATAIENMPATQLAISAYSLEQNYPNPFNPSTKIRYQLTRPVLVNLTIYNIHGQKVESLLNQYQPAGMHEIVWNAQYLSGGIYYCQLQAGDYSETRKLIYLK